jgi:hypothetical protein
MFIPAITKQACRARDRTGDQDHLSSQTPSWAGQVSPRLPAMIKTGLRGSSTPAQCLPVDQAKESRSKIIT